MLPPDRQDHLWEGPIILKARFFPLPKSYPKRIHEAAALARALEPLERAEAKERKREVLGVLRAVSDAGREKGRFPCENGLTG